MTEYNDDEPLEPLEPVSASALSPAQMLNPGSGPGVPLNKRKLGEASIGEADDLSCFKRVRVISKSSRDNSVSLSQDTKNTRSVENEAITSKDDESLDEEKGSIYTGYNSTRSATYFVNGFGIDREVITNDITRYLGNDALIKPGSYQPVTITLLSRFRLLHQYLTLF